MTTDVKLIERLRDAQAGGVGSAKLFNLLDEAAAALEAARETRCTAPPSAPVGVEGLVKAMRTLAGVGIPVKPECVGRWADQLEALAQQPAAVDGAMVFRMAAWMAKNDGHDDPHHLIWEGSPPEPWGEVWNRYEDDARAAITAALAAQPQGCA